MPCTCSHRAAPPPPSAIPLLFTPATRHPRCRGHLSVGLPPSDAATAQQDESKHTVARSRLRRLSLPHDSPRPRHGRRHPPSPQAGPRQARATTSCWERATTARSETLHAISRCIYSISLRVVQPASQSCTYQIASPAHLRSPRCSHCRSLRGRPLVGRKHSCCCIVNCCGESLQAGVDLRVAHGVLRSDDIDI